MILDPWFYVLAIPAVLLTGVSKGGLAGGIGLLAVPAMALVIPPVQAAGIMLPILIVMDLIGVWAYRRSFHAGHLWALIPGAAVGILLGALTAGFVSDAHVRLIVGLVAVVFALNFWLRSAESLAARAKPGAWSGRLWGGVAGYTSFVAHAGSPPFQVYMLPQGIDRKLYVGTSVMFFWLVNLIKLPPYALLGQLAPGNLMTSLVLMPLAPLGMWLGLKLVDKVPEQPFYRLIYALVLIVGVKLVWDGVTGSL